MLYALIYQAIMRWFCEDYDILFIQLLFYTGTADSVGTTIMLVRRLRGFNINKLANKPRFKIGDEPQMP